jgi:fatty-acyl-CoA synthase
MTIAALPRPGRCPPLRRHSAHLRADARTPVLAHAQACVLTTLPPDCWRSASPARDRCRHLGRRTASNELLVQLGHRPHRAILVNIKPAFRAANWKQRAAEDKLPRADHGSPAQIERLRGDAEIARTGNRKHRPATQPLRTREISVAERAVLIGDGARPAGDAFIRAIVSLAGPAHRINRLPALSAALDPDDPIKHPVTAGTTGLPKVATLSSRNIVNNARYQRESHAAERSDRLCIPVRSNHCFRHGARRAGLCRDLARPWVFPGESFDAEETLRTVQELSCTALHGVPAMFIAQLGHPRVRQVTIISSLMDRDHGGRTLPIENHAPRRGVKCTCAKSP